MSDTEDELPPFRLSGLEIVEASPRDRRHLIDGFREVVLEGTSYAFETVAEMERAWNRPGTHLYVARHGDRVVGAYHLEPNHPGRGRHVGHLSVLVRRPHRRLGLGSKLILDAVERAPALGFKALQANLLASTNEASIKACEAAGFQRIGLLPEAFRHEREGLVDALILHRSL
jgi:L-amino acid N-acyltransferase YncA